MTLEDVAAIRAVAGIDVAAPIGEVIIPMLSTPQAQFALPKGVAGANEVPQAFRVTVTYLTDDGLGERLVSAETFTVIVDEAPRQERELTGCNINGYDVTPEEYPLIATRICSHDPRDNKVFVPTGGGWSASDTEEGDSLLFTLGSGLMSSTRVTLVDPAAERALLGDAGDFLLPLEELAAGGGVAEPETMDAWAAANPGRLAEQFLRMREAIAEAEIGMPADELAEWKRLYEANGAVYEPEFEVWDPPYVPLLGRTIPPAPLQLRVEVEAFGDAPVSTSEEWGFPYVLPEALGDGAGDPVGTTVVDASAMLNPFANETTFVPWPGTSAEGLVGPPWATMLSIFVVGTTDPLVAEVLADSADGVEVRLAANDYFSPFFNPQSLMGNVFAARQTGLKPGEEAVFAANPYASSVSPSTHGTLVGDFGIDEITALQSELSRVPLGAYQSVGSTLIPGSSPAAADAIELRPSVSGLGLVSPETVAIASLESASAWGDAAPVNAVRVRVADVGVFGADAIGTIANVAAAIEKLGFTATVVAGSSPTDVTVHVDGYAFGVTDPDAKQTVGPLGAVIQRWSELGAASRVDLAVSTSSFGVLAVALGASALLLAAVQLAGVPARRRQASVMRTIGWRRSRILRWMAAEELVSLAIVAVAGVAALLLASSRSAVTIAVGGSVAALVVTSTLAVVLGARPLATGVRSVRRRRQHRVAEAQAWVTSTWRLALRQVTVHRLNAMVQLLATIVVAVSAAAITVTLIEGRAAAGASALGVFAVDQAFVAQLTLGSVALVAGVVLAVIARRIDLGRRREQWATMRAMGWSAGQVRTVQLIEGLVIGIPAIVIAGAVALSYVTYVAAELTGMVVSVGTGAAVVLTVVLVLASWREKR